MDFKTVAGAPYGMALLAIGIPLSATADFAMALMDFQDPSKHWCYGAEGLVGVAMEIPGWSFTKLPPDVYNAVSAVGAKNDAIYSGFTAATGQQMFPSACDIILNKLP